MLWQAGGGFSRRPQQDLQAVRLHRSNVLVRRAGRSRTASLPLPPAEGWLTGPSWPERTAVLILEVRMARTWRSNDDMPCFRGHQ